jgi:hypothetical protein
MCWFNGKNARYSQYKNHEKTKVKIQTMYLYRTIEACSRKHICGGKKVLHILSLRL